MYKSLQAFMGSYSYWCEANEMFHHFNSILTKPSQSIIQRSQFAKDKEAIQDKNYLWVIKVISHSLTFVVLTGTSTHVVPCGHLYAA